MPFDARRQAGLAHRDLDHTAAGLHALFGRLGYGIVGCIDPGRGVEIGGLVQRHTARHERRSRACHSGERRAQFV
ncbi:MAG: hypothetical protein EAZ36_01565, partial [Verrucomicrobia bacterium]